MKRRKRMSSNKHVLITEIDSEVGAALAACFAAEGWKVTGVVLPGNNKSGKHLECDLMDRKAAVQVVAKAEAAQGELTAMLVCPKFTMQSITAMPFLGSSLQDWKNKLNAWLRLTANICWAAGKVMVERNYGRILVITPDFRNVEGDCIIEATVAGALHGFVKSLGCELAGNNVNVNGVFPSLPVDQEALNQMCLYLVEEADYVSAQLISIQGQN
jgi:NAD(P)-dependent dehydrogenase (short-subunit alcohol dehydrogenase family)